MGTNWAFETVSLADLSDLAFTYQIAICKDHRKILVVAFSGEYRPGSAGNPDAAFMCGTAAAGINAFNPGAVIFDFSKLRYIWGDMLETVYNTAPAFTDSETQRFAVVVGDGCEEAIRTLELGQDSTDPISTIRWVHYSIEDACQYLEDNVL